MTTKKEWLSAGVKRDLIRLLGLVLVVAGEFLAKDKFKLLDQKIFTNMTQLIGVCVIFGPSLYKLIMARLTTPK